MAGLQSVVGVAGQQDPVGSTCDDGNAVNCDTCSNICTNIPGCGDGQICGAEACDDGNKIR